MAKHSLSMYSIKPWKNIIDNEQVDYLNWGDRFRKKATETWVIINNYILNQIGMLGIRY